MLVEGLGVALVAYCGMGWGKRWFKPNATRLIHACPITGPANCSTAFLPPSISFLR